MLQKRITRKDIANMAGTSVSVVSRALNNSGYVAEEKKKRILEIAEEYEYNPNPLALTLQKQRMKQVLFYCKDIKNTYFIQMYQGMTKCAVPRGYKVFINGIMEYSDIRNILIDGIIMPNQELAHRYFEETGKNYCIPVVCASYGDDIYLQKAVPMVEVDMYKVMETALDYLYSMGHKIISLAMPYPYEDNSARTKSYISWCRKHGINNPEEYFIGVSDRY